MNAFFKDERGDYNRVSSSVSDFAQLTDDIMTV